jgi:hypothetical protein
VEAEFAQAALNLPAVQQKADIGPRRADIKYLPMTSANECGRGSDADCSSMKRSQDHFSLSEFSSIAMMHTQHRRATKTEVAISTNAMNEIVILASSLGYTKSTAATMNIKKIAYIEFLPILYNESLLKLNIIFLYSFHSYD